MTILKSCVHRPVAKIDDGPRDQRKAVVLHTAVSRATSLFDFWQGGSAGKGIGSHIYIAEDGHAEQYLDTSRETGHAFAANAFTVGIETWDNADPDHTPWTQAQLDKIIAICQELGVPGKALLEGPSDGVGFHRQFPSWNENKHSCPGDLRVNQVKTVIIPALQGGDVTQDEFDEMHAKSHRVRVDRLAEVADSALALSDWAEGTEPADPGRKAIVDKLKGARREGGSPG